jgi:hypothetical protein
MSIAEHTQKHVLGLDPWVESGFPIRIRAEQDTSFDQKRREKHEE